MVNYLQKLRPWQLAKSSEVQGSISSLDKPLTSGLILVILILQSWSSEGQFSIVHHKKWNSIKISWLNDWKRSQQISKELSKSKTILISSLNVGRICSQHDGIFKTWKKIKHGFLPKISFSHLKTISNMDHLACKCKLK